MTTLWLPFALHDTSRDQLTTVNIFYCIITLCVMYISVFCLLHFWFQFYFSMSSMHIYVCVCVYMYMYCVCVCVCTCTIYVLCTCLCVYVCVHVQYMYCVHVCVCTCVFVHVSRTFYIKMYICKFLFLSLLLLNTYQTQYMDLN